MPVKQFIISKKRRVLVSENSPHYGVCKTLHLIDASISKKKKEKLVLRKVSVTETILENFLLSPHLETIVIHHARYLKHVHIGGRNLKLKHFEIVATTTVSSIVLSDFDLESFTYKGSKTELDLAHLSMLREIDMYDGHIRLNSNMFKQIASCALSLQHLSIYIVDPTKSLNLHSLPVLPNVKKLRLAIGSSKYNCLEYLGAILSACPNLENFTRLMQLYLFT
ncbi:F-box domain, FBD domain, Leucine-rich repeat domain, L domain-like protein [Artemisia annua]|uniref:F-box domain, FBD domain, Leucine-rich repeat domain, L domain-like protein n=1 Tax=Artemisia annua TaxID=35608 RepID=A0A2U1MC16_ARTAN|nr:F-box domain, FBD domain, Leucine-rich repeat domain, L domain-like protein [Artemisia annua]